MYSHSKLFKEDTVRYLHSISESDLLSFISLYVGSNEADKQDKVMLLFQILIHYKYSIFLNIFTFTLGVLSPVNNNFPPLPLVERQIKKSKVNRSGSVILNHQTWDVLDQVSGVTVHLFKETVNVFFYY